MTHKNYIPILALLSLSALAITPVTAHAQNRLAPVSIYFRDVPVRSALEQVFNKAGLQYYIDPQVSGVVTLKIRSQSFENALKLILSNSKTPLTYTRENNVHIVRPRQAAPEITNTPNTEASPTYRDSMPPQPWNNPFYFVTPVPPLFLGGPIVLDSSGMGGFGAGSFNSYMGGSFVSGLGGFGTPYWGGFNNFGFPNGGYFGGGIYLGGGYVL